MIPAHRGAFGADELVDALGLLPYVFLLIGTDMAIRHIAGDVESLLGRSGGSLIDTSALELLHPDDLERVATVLADVGQRAVPSAERPIGERPIASRHIEMPLRVLHHDGRWVSVGATGRKLPESELFMIGLRPNQIVRDMDDLMAGLATGVPVDGLVSVVVRMMQSQFATEHAWLIRSSRPEAVLAFGAEVADAYAIGAAIHGTSKLSAETAAEAMELSRDGDVHATSDNRYWLAGIRGPDGSPLGLVVIENPRYPETPSFYDSEIMRRTAGIASLVLQREVDDVAVRIAASSDPLTGAFNRASFAAAISHLTVDDLPAAVIYVDVDGFKSINDQHGHQAGDAVLRRTVERLRGAVRAEDMVARLGGDEFAVLCRRVDRSVVDRLTLRTRQALAERSGESLVQTGGHHPADDPHASVGCAFAGTLESVSDVVDRADSDMYRVKRERQSGLPTARSAE